MCSVLLAYSFSKSISNQQIPIADTLKEVTTALLGNYKKKHAKARQDGEVTESAAGAMSAAAYRTLCHYAIGQGNTFMWSWLTQQWNLMSRSINVAGLLLNQVGVEGDAFTETFIVTKTGQGGEGEHMKHIYANPLSPEVCPFLSLALHLMQTSERLPNDPHL